MRGEEPTESTKQAGENIDDRVAELRKSLNNLPPLKKSQTSILALAGQSTDEGSWRKILRYLLDPSAPHGLDDLVLQYFLSVLVDEEIIDEVPQWKQGSISVEEEIAMGGGYIDIVIRCRGEWFIAIEMKVLSPEDPGQTVKYAQSEYIGGERVDEYPTENRHFVYLSSPYDEPESNEFGSLSWPAVGRSLRMAITSETGQQSIRGLTQLRTFTNSINAQFHFIMNSETNENAVNERLVLYNEYREEIEALEQAFEEFTYQIQSQWEQRLTQRIDSVSWGTEWYTRTNSNQLQLYKDEWVFLPESPENVTESPLLHMEAKISAKKLREGYFTFIFSVGLGANSELESPPEGEGWPEVIGKLCASSEQFEKKLPERAELVGASGPKTIVTKARYEGIQNETDFYRTLAKSVSDHLPAANVLTEILQEEVRSELVGE